MRSIIFTSAMVLATGAWAGDGLPRGCFERDYTAAHLAANPAQIVDDIRLKIYDQPGYDAVVAEMRVRFADQGRLRGTAHAGQVMEQFLICWSDGSQSGCSVECDGGMLEMTRVRSDSITFATRSLWVGNTDECGGSENLAEVQGQPVKYRLNRVADARCEAD